MQADVLLVELKLKIRGNNNMKKENEIRRDDLTVDEDDIFGVVGEFLGFEIKNILKENPESQESQNNTLGGEQR